MCAPLVAFHLLLWVHARSRKLNPLPCFSHLPTDPSSLSFCPGPGGGGGGGGASAESDRERVSLLDLPPAPWLARALPRLLAKALGDRAAAPPVARARPDWAVRASAASGGGESSRAAAAASGALAAMDTVAPTWGLGDDVFGGGGGGVVVCGLDLDPTKVRKGEKNGGAGGAARQVSVER